jgi:lipoprotein-anchoring transpeptidase ErfK/SrfK
MDAVNSAPLSGKGGASLLKLQILLDRAHASPGQIDGRRGENTRKAINAFRLLANAPGGSKADASVRIKLGEDKEPALVKYQITEEDVAGPFIAEVPQDYREKAKLKRLAYTAPSELLAEKFHVSEAVLKTLNPDAKFDQAGAEIVVPNVQRGDLPKVKRIEVDGAEQQVKVFAEGDQLVAIYPATVGSSERPSPVGEFKVHAVVKDPVYYYDPKNNLRGVDVQEKLDIPPGPNNPVGSIWIDLSRKGYGLHGTPDPDKISKAASHGCVRLTNWDAEELASHVRKGVPVIITGGQQRHRRQARSRH